MSAMEVFFSEEGVAVFSCRIAKLESSLTEKLKIFSFIEEFIVFYRRGYNVIL